MQTPKLNLKHCLSAKEYRMKILACYSNKGGVGKTATSVNLALAFAQAGYRTLLCDLDPQGASGYYFRVKPSKKLTNEKFFKGVENFASAIRGSDYDNLDILPANMTFRDFDVFLSRMKKPKSQLTKALKNVNDDYDIIILDCPPNISSLSESVFCAADHIVIPVIPTTLSERTLEQLMTFFDEKNIDIKKMVPFFSMVQRQKNMHIETMARLKTVYPKIFLNEPIPFSTDIELMGVHRAPVATFAKSRPASSAYNELWTELVTRI